MAKFKLRMDSRKAGSILIAFIMLFSALGVVGEFFTGKDDKQTGDQYLDTLGGKDVYKKSDVDYYILDKQRNIELHFRSNPLVAKNITINREAGWMLDYLQGGPSGYLAAFYNTSKIGILMDPNEETRLVTSATEITQALGFIGWPPELIEAAFTSASNRTDIPVLTEKEAHASNDTLYFYLYIQPDENATVKYFGKIIYVQAPDYNALDLAADRVKLRLFGYI